MNSRSNIKTGLSLLNAIMVLALLRNVIKKMTGNAFFPDPPVSLVDAEGKGDELEVAIEEATEGSKASKTRRNALANECRDILRKLANYQRTEADGDEVKLTTGGFELAKRPEPINVVGVPKNVVASPSDSKGAILVRWGRTEGGRTFRLEQAMSDPTLGATTWVQVGVTTRQRFVVTGQPSLQECWFRVIAVGKTHEGIPSDVVIGYAA